MDDTENLKLPYILAAQAQKHVTHNEALRALDAIVQLTVLDRDLTTPPGSPSEGDRYIVGPSATGAWASMDGQIAAWQDGAWAFYVPNDGWLAWVSDEDVLCVLDGSAWAVASDGGVNPTPLVGVNTTADTTNRLSVKSPASLFNHDGDDHQQKINKAAAGDTASQLYQTNFSGRAEIGLTGDDDFHFKVSPNCTTFHEAIVIDKDDGSVALPNTPVAENLLFNIFEDAGRFGGTPEDQSASAGSYVAPSYVTAYNGAVLTAGDKFIHNNTTYGGSAGVLGTDVDELIQLIRSDSGSNVFRRYGPEFFVMDIAAGSGTSAPTFNDGVDDLYLAITNTPVPFWPRSSINYWAKATSGKFGINPSGGTWYVDNVAITSGQSFQSSDGWKQITAVFDINPFTFLGYISDMFRLHATPSASVHLAMPCLFPAQIKPSGIIGVVPSVRVWR